MIFNRKISAPSRHHLIIPQIPVLYSMYLGGVMLIPLLLLWEQVLQLSCLFFSTKICQSKMWWSLPFTVSDRVAGGISKVPNEGKFGLPLIEMKSSWKKNAAAGITWGGEDFDRTSLWLSSSSSSSIYFNTAMKSISDRLSEYFSLQVSWLKGSALWAAV